MCRATLALDPTRVRWGDRGDFVIELRRSLIGETWSPQQTAQSINLVHRGEQALGFAHDHSFTGRAAKYPHLFASCLLDEFITLPRRRKPISSHRTDADRRRQRESYFDVWERLMRPIQYPAADSSGIRGEFFEPPDEEYVQVEQDAEGATVLWSTVLPLDNALDRIDDAMGPSTPNDGGYVVSINGETTERDGDEVEQLARRDPQRVGLYVASYGETSVSWQRERVKLKGGNRLLAECSFAGDHIDMKLLSRLVQETATDGVKDAFKASTNPVIHALGNRALGI